MRDPDIVILLDHDDKTVEAYSYEMSALGIYEEFFDVNGELVKSPSQLDCNNFLNQWFKNIKAQGYLDRKELEYIESKDVSSLEVQTVNHDFSYEEDWQPNNGGDKSRFTKNIESIRTLKLIEEENRSATKGEQIILSQYVGWGGWPMHFLRRMQHGKK